MGKYVEKINRRNSAQNIYDFLKIGLLAAVLALLDSSSLVADDVKPLNAEGVIEFTGNDQMKYNISAFEVTVGQEVTIVLKNIGKLPKVAMAHNVVVLKMGTDVMQFAIAGIAAKDNGYISPGMEDKVIAKTELAGPGETVKITFTAPSEPGAYPYLCTFPAHFMAGMKGLMTVKAPS